MDLGNHIGNIKTKAADIMRTLKDMPLMSSLKTFILIAVTILLLIYVFLKVDYNSFVESLSKIDYRIFLILVILSLIELYLYTHRFMMSLNLSLNFIGHLHYMVGFVLGRIVPPRPFGEYLRIVTVSHYFKVDTKKSFFAVAVDNLYDIIVLLPFGILGAIIVSKSGYAISLLLVVLVIFGLLILIQTLYSNLIFLRNIYGVRYFYTILVYLRDSFLKYFSDLFNIGKSTLYVGVTLTIINYVISFTKMYIILRVLGVTDVSYVTVAAIWSLVNALSGISMLPGGLGAFEIAFMALMADYGVSNEIAISAAIIERFFNIWMFSILTGLYLIYSRTSISNLNESFLRKLSSIISRGYRVIKDRSKPLSNKKSKRE